MNLVFSPTPEAACARAADIVAEVVAARPDAVLALPAGNTPRPVYAELARRHRGQAAVVRARDGVQRSTSTRASGPITPASFRRFLRDELYRHVDLPAARAHAPDGHAADLDAECAVTSARSRRRAASTCALLGIGGNGHIAFNEPGSPFDSRTRVVICGRDARRAPSARSAPRPCPRAR